MIVTRKVEELSFSIVKGHTNEALDQSVEVNLTRTGREWIGHTDKLKKGNYQCRVVYQL